MPENTLPELAEWVAGVYQIETTDPVIGGPEGISNRQARELARRTLWLKQEIEAIAGGEASEAEAGLIVLATLAEALAGVNAVKAMTPATVKAVVASAVAGLVDSSPAVLDTLAELAAALGNDADFASHVSNALALKAPLDSPHLAGIPTGPTAAPGTATTQLASTEFVHTEIAAAAPKGLLTAVRVVAINPIVLSGLQTIDGVELAAGDRVLVAGQADHVANGPYVVAAGAWARAADSAVGVTLKAGTVVPVMAGAASADSLWMLSNDADAVVGTDATAWARTGGDGLPVGAVMVHSGTVAPAGCLIANGAAVARATYAQLDIAMYVGDAGNATAAAYYRCTDAGNPTGTRSTTGAYLVLPDYRGVMLRGLDQGRGLDPDAARLINSYQADLVKDHQHQMRYQGQTNTTSSPPYSFDWSASYITNIGSTGPMVVGGGTETRGKNTTVLICIKAFSASTNQGLIDITALANEVAAWRSAPAGTIIHHAASAAPAGYLKANGALVSRTTYAALFAAIGTTFGAGDGVNTFALPDLRGEFMRGWDDGRGADGGRTLGSWQKGTAFMGDGDGTNQPVVNLNDVTQAAVLGFDLDTTPSNATSVAIAYGANAVGSYSVTGMHGAGAASNYIDFARTRPRNVAVLACIKY